MRDSVATSETSFFFMRCNFENSFSKLMTVFVGICFYYLLLLALILSLVCNKNKQPLMRSMKKCVLETNRYIRLMGRSSHQRCPVRKGVLRNFAKFTGNHLCQSF